ncbi:MAG: dTMP kinase [candidate division Zixibacteria bacterium]|nr:dTMP kinase [candidate division Zixibacteria bacterium]
MKKRRGFFLVVEGADASGKTTLVKRLGDSYDRLGWTVTSVREPGGTVVSEKVRRVLLDPGVSMNARAELFLYLAARAQVVDEVIVPALKRGELVIADRFSLSTYAYQIGGRRLPARAVMSADRLARAGVSPDLTLLLTVTSRQSAERRQEINRKRDRIEQEPPGFFQAVRAEYSRWGRNKPGIIVIDSGLGADGVYNRARQLLDRSLRMRTV